MRRAVAALALFALPAQTGCEGCDFSFGPVPVHVIVTPDVRATVTLCPRTDPCEVAVTESTDTGLGGYCDYGPDGNVASFCVGWQGYVTCLYPQLEITVGAEGCETQHVSVPARRPRDDFGVEVEVALDCD
jgi:hypothetical protein